MKIEIRDMQSEDEAFVGSCTHVGETAEWTACCERRLPWLRAQYAHGLRAKVALVDGRHAGFLLVMPIEIAPWGPVGDELMALQCLTVEKDRQGTGVGRALVKAAEEEARYQRKKGVAVHGYYHDFWFMQATFFEHLGYAPIARQGDLAILWKPFDGSAVAPSFPVRRYRFEPLVGRVAIDLFWSLSCLTTAAEAQHVRDVAEEFGDKVGLREYCSDDAGVRLEFGVFRGIYIDGREVSWGYEAPKDGLREAIRSALGARS